MSDSALSAAVGLGLAMACFALALATDFRAGDHSVRSRVASGLAGLGLMFLIAGSVVSFSVSR